MAIFLSCNTCRCLIISSLLIAFLLLPLPGLAMESDQRNNLRSGKKPFDSSGSGISRLPAKKFKDGEILVKFKTAAAGFSIDDSLRRNSAKMLRRLRITGTMLWSTTKGREKEIIERLRANPLVEYAEPNYIYHALSTPNDPHFNNQWAHGKIDSEQGWNITEGSVSTVIAIIDSGIDENHPDLEDKIVAGIDKVDDDNDPHDTHGHGTHVAGIATAITDNSTGVAGMDWNARIMPVRVLDSQGTGNTADIVDAVNWACDNGAKVLNLSLGGTGRSQALQNAINNVLADGCLVVAAMGNYRTSENPTIYPAAYDNVFAVAATSRSDTYARYSQHGDHCDISAPGGNMDYYQDTDGIYSTMPTYSVHLTTDFFYLEDYDYLQGTSQATPLVAGLAALIWSVAPTLTPDRVQEVIQNTAIDLGAPGKDNDYGHGRIDVQAALQAVEADTDYDGLSNELEDTMCTEADDDDSDDDGIPDGTEDVNRNGALDAGETDPCNPDSDGDGIEDANRDGIKDDGETDPRDADTDDDGISDGTEDANRNGAQDAGETDPCNPDSDGDGIQDGTELGYTAPGPGTDPTVFVPDSHPISKTDPLDPDTDDDSYSDGAEDLNYNGRVEYGETNPVDPRSYPGAPPQKGFLLIPGKSGNTAVVPLDF